MFLGRSRQLKQCSVSVAASGVFFTPEYHVLIQKMSGEAQRGQNICWGSFGGKMFILPPSLTLPLPPSIGLPQRVSYGTLQKNSISRSPYPHGAKISRSG